jgi:hypothetical protein
LNTTDNEAEIIGIVRGNCIWTLYINYIAEYNETVSKSHGLFLNLFSHLGRPFK